MNSRIAADEDEVVVVDDEETSASAAASGDAVEEEDPCQKTHHSYVNAVCLYQAKMNPTHHICTNLINQFIPGANRFS